MINKSITAITVAAVVISMYFSYIIIVHFANNNNNVIGIISIGAAIPSINTCTNRIKLCQRPMKARQCNAATKQHKIRLSAFRKHEQSSQGCCQRLMLFIRWSNDISYFYFLYIFFFLVISIENVKIDCCFPNDFIGFSKANITLPRTFADNVDGNQCHRHAHW